MVKLFIGFVLAVVVVGLSIGLGLSLSGAFDATEPSEPKTLVEIRDRELVPYYKFDYTKPFSRFSPQTPVGCSDEAVQLAEQFSVAILLDDGDLGFWFAQGIRFGRYVVTVGHAVPDNPRAIRLFEEGQWMVYPIKEIWHELDAAPATRENLLKLKEPKDAALYMILPNTDGQLPGNDVPSIVSPADLQEGAPLCGMRPSSYFDDRTFLHEGWIGKKHFPQEMSFQFYVNQGGPGSSGSAIIAPTADGAAIIGMHVWKRLTGAWLDEERPRLNVNSAGLDIAWVISRIEQETGIALLNP